MEMFGSFWRNITGQKDPNGVCYGCSHKHGEHQHGAYKICKHKSLPYQASIPVYGKKTVGKRTDFDTTYESGKLVTRPREVWVEVEDTSKELGRYTTTLTNSCYCQGCKCPSCY